jgi:mannobiose 2-epimerase
MCHAKVLAVVFFVLSCIAQAQESSKLGRAELLDMRATLERVLNENIVPFWYPQVIDKENGGYRLNHDVNGKYQGESTKGIVTQARTVWFFSRLYNSPYGKEEHLVAARHGYVFLRDRMWDREHGGFFAMVSSDGKVGAGDYKHLYGEGFGLYALVEYWRASRDPEALDLARRLVATLDYYAYDPPYGGYREFFTREWNMPTSNAKSFMGVPPDVKLYNTHLHLLEPMTQYYRATREGRARDRLIELIGILSNGVVRKTVGACSDKHDRRWLPLHGPEYDVASYGHDLENIWLLIEANNAAGLSNGPYEDLYRTLFSYAMRYGFDEKNGGFYYFGPFNKPATNLGKSWWVQAEALVASLRMYERTGEGRYYECFRRTLDWVVKHQVDWKGGDWFADIRADGTPSGQKAGLWKSPYHHGRSVLECIGIIEELLRRNE